MSGDAPVHGERTSAGASTPADVRSRLRSPGPYVVVLVVGLLVATGAALGADRQPIIWMIPPLILTAVALVAIRLADHRAEGRTIGAAAAELGLRDAGVQPLPPVGAILERPEPAHVVTGELEPGGPPCRLAVVRTRRGTLAVCLTDAPDHGVRLADPHGLVGAPQRTAEPELVAWLAEHPLRPALATEDGALVVGSAVRRGEEPPLAALREAAREARARLS